MLSTVEYKLIIAFFAVILLLSAVRTSDFVIFAYNRSVESSYYEKNRLANNHQKIVFSGGCNPCTSDPYEIIIPFQIVFLAFAFGGLIIRNTGSIIASTLILLSIVYGYLDWMRVTYKHGFGSENYDYGNSSLKSHFLLNFMCIGFRPPFICICAIYHPVRNNRSFRCGTI